MKVIDLVKKMGGASNPTIRILEGGKLVAEYAKKDLVRVAELKRQITFFNIVDNVLIINVKVTD